MVNKENDYMIKLKKIAVGVVVSTIIASGLFLFKLNLLSGELLLYETIPYYTPSKEIAEMFKIVPDGEIFGGKAMSLQNGADGGGKGIYAVSGENTAANILETVKNESDEYMVYTDGISLNEYEEVFHKGQIRDVNKIEDSAALYGEVEVIGTQAVVYQQEPASVNVEGHFSTENITIDNIAELRNMQSLQKQFYIVDKETGMTPDIFDIDKFMSVNLKLNEKTSGPKVLIFHTHAREMYSDSDRDNPYDGVVGVGESLAKALKERYGIESIHITEGFDTVDGRSKVAGAYERMEPVIQNILAENPSLEFVIDIHRDALSNPDIKLVTDINGKETAKIMFVNGLTSLYDDNGVLSDIAELPNPNRDANLALSFNLQLASNKLYPSFARKIYLKGYRYSTNMCPKSILVEVGAATNTKQEAFNAAEPLSDIIANVVLPMQ